MAALSAACGLPPFQPSRPTLPGNAERASVAVIAEGSAFARPGVTEGVVSLLEQKTGRRVFLFSAPPASTDAQWQTVPASASVYGRLKPVYEELDGWKTDTALARSWTDLPAPARAYVERLEALAGVPISHVSVGPAREQMIVRS